MELTAKKQGFSSERLERLTGHLQSYVSKGFVAGVNGMIARNNEVLYAESLGQQSMGEKAMSMDSIFRIYSMTKPITSVAALMLYEEGHLLLDDPVAKFLPYFADTKVCKGSGHTGLELEPQLRLMTIRDLLMHTSGLSYGWFQDTPVDVLYREAPLQTFDSPLADYVEQLASLPLVFQPGTNWRYSHSTDVLGHLVEVVAGESLDGFLENRIFKPLGMKDSAFEVPTEKLERFTSVYCPTEKYEFGFDYSSYPKDGKVHPIDTPERSLFVKPKVLVRGFSGGGGLVSTMSDYYHFASMLLNGGCFNGVQLLGRKTIELMSQNHVPKHIRPLESGGVAMPGIGFGLGVSVLEDLGGQSLLGSEGLYAWGGAAMTSFWIDPKEHMIGLVMTQFMPNDFYRLTDEFRVLSYQALLD